MPSRKFTSGFQVTAEPLPPVEQLGPIWLELQSRSTSSFFVSWSWIKCWIKWLPQGIDAELIQLLDGQRPIALAIFVRTRQRRHKGLIRSRSLHLNSTGIESLDELTIEYNGILAERSREQEAAREIFDYLLARDPHWDELFLDGLEPRFLPDLPEQAKANWRRRVVPVHLVDLQAARQSSSGYLGLIGNNTRYQIRSSIRHFEKQGLLRITPARTVEEALEGLDGIKRLQTPRWNQRGIKGSFELPEFEQFHRALIEASFHTGCIQMLTVQVGERTLGYLYNFVHDGAVLHYQVGIDYQHFGGTLNPGLVANRLAIEFNAQAGHRQYNFLAGDTLYKRRMATDSEQIIWAVLQRTRLRFRIEDHLRESMRKLRARRKSSSSGQR